MVINTNQNAVEATSTLQKSHAAMNRSIARLSTGSKILQPSDDAAGLSNSEKMLAQGSRIEAARVNIQNAVSLTQTADGFLSSMNDVLNRMSELSILAQDVTKSAGDQALYNTEFEKLKEQLRDVIGNGDNGTDGDPNWNMGSTDPSGSFNGIVLFGARADMTIVVGATGSQTIEVSEINLRRIGGAMSDLLWDNSVDGSQPDLNMDSPSAISKINSAIEQLADERAKIGADLSRIGLVEAQLQVQEENLSAANSRIWDVDVAVETTRLAKNQILTEASSSMLQQTNDLPRLALRLLNS